MWPCQAWCGQANCIAEADLNKVKKQGFGVYVVWGLGQHVVKKTPHVLRRPYHPTVSRARCRALTTCSTRAHHAQSWGPLSSGFDLSDRGARRVSRMRPVQAHANRYRLRVLLSGGRSKDSSESYLPQM